MIIDPDRPTTFFKMVFDRTPGLLRQLDVGRKAVTDGQAIRLVCRFGAGVV